MNAHTPGPWQVWKFDERSVAVGPLAGGLAVAEIVTVNGHGIATAQTEQTGQTNARLIAAAPDLLAALRDLLDACPETYDNRHERAAAEDAIAKAEGGEA